MLHSGFAAIRLIFIIHVMKQRLILLPRVGWSVSSTQKWKKELIISTDTQNSGECNNHQLQVAPGDLVSCNGQLTVRSAWMWRNVSEVTHLNGLDQKLTRKALWRLILCYCSLVSAALSALVLKCNGMEVCAFDTSWEDKCNAASPCLGWVCRVQSTLWGGLGGVCGAIQIHPGKARYTNSSVSVILYCCHTLKQSESCHLSQISWTSSMASVVALQWCLRLTAMTQFESEYRSLPWVCGSNICRTFSSLTSTCQLHS